MSEKLSKEHISIQVKNTRYLFAAFHAKEVNFLTSFRHAVSDIIDDFPKTSQDYLSLLKNSPNPLAKRYLKFIQTTHSRCYDVLIDNDHLSRVDLALFACHFNIKIGLLIPQNDHSSTDCIDCTLHPITPNTIESYLPPFTFETQLLETEQFQLFRLGPARHTICILCHSTDNKDHIKGLFTSLSLQKGGLPL